MGKIVTAQILAAPIAILASINSDQTAALLLAYCATLYCYAKYTKRGQSFIKKLGEL